MKPKPFVAEANEFLNRNRNLKTIHIFEHSEKLYVGFNDVFSPQIFEDTYFFMEALEQFPTERFLEVGCGAGLISVAAAARGAQVTATDINPSALRNTMINAIAHDVEKQICVINSDVFDGVNRLDTYDLVFWNAPFIYSPEPASAGLSLACFSFEYRSIEKYLAGASVTLRSGATTRFLLGFSRDSGDFARLTDLARDAGLGITEEANRLLSQPAEPAFTVSLLQLHLQEKS